MPTTTDIVLQVSSRLFDVEADLRLQLAGGPFSISLSPKQSVVFLDLWDAISAEIESIAGFGLPDLSSGPWGAILQVPKDFTVRPMLWVSPSGNSQGGLAVYLELAFDKPVGVGGEWPPPSQQSAFRIVLEPHIQVYSLYLGYDAAQGGLDFRAKITTQTSSGISSPGGEKTQIVTYPFPVPAQQSVGVFTIHYLGLGQRVGPTVVVNDDDPMAAIFNQLETELVGDDPTTILTRLANDFYHPDRDWFIAADVELRGFRIRAIFNDPTLYGLEISVDPSSPTPFAGLLFEVLYEKLGPNLGVYYGALTLPTAFRRIVIEGVILILPGFSIWVYTNGDFRVNVGWPLGPASIGIQVGVLIGAGGFYFAKLRSSDNPGAQPGPDYNPILAFGIGVTLYVREGFTASIFSANLSVTLTATFQGLLAWKAGNTVAAPPDHFWFAGTAGLAIYVQGSVDFGIIKASVTISFTAYAGVAFETGYRTVISVSASVNVDVSVKVVFFTIHLKFSTSISHQFTIGTGPDASINGPLAPGLSIVSGAQLPSLLSERARGAAARMIDALAPPTSYPTGRGFAPHAGPARARNWYRHSTVADPLGAPASGPETFNVHFVLQPTVIYPATGGPGAYAAVAALFIDSPVPGAESPSPQTDFERLIRAMVRWLLSLFPGGKLSDRFAIIDRALGSGSGRPPFGSWDTFEEHLSSFLQSSCVFHITAPDLSVDSAERAVAVLPMFDVLRMETRGPDSPAVVDFNSFNATPDDYDLAVNDYFADVAFNGANPAASLKAGRHARLSWAAGSPPTGRSMATFVFLDYFALQARNAASALHKAALAYEGSATAEFLAGVHGVHAASPVDPWDLMDMVREHAADVTGDPELETLLARFDYVSAAGISSRFMLNGLQLPIPSLVPAVATKQNMLSVPTDGLFLLTGQQFSVPTEQTDSPVAAVATLMVNPNISPCPNWVTFAGGDSATCALPLPDPVPPSPAPAWCSGGSPDGPAPDTIQVAALPPLTSHPLWYSIKNQIAWEAPTGASTILPFPAPLVDLLTTRKSLQVQISTEAPPDTNGPAPSVSPASLIAGTPALLIRISLSQVPATPDAGIELTGSPPAEGGPPAEAGGTKLYLPYVYQLGGADEQTRDLIYQALLGDLTGASLALLHTPPVSAASPFTSNYLQSSTLAGDVLLAKTNLSTLNQAAEVAPPFAMMMAAVSPSDREEAAAITDVAAFLRLVWEVSVVNASGFFLYYRTADGQDLPSGLFSDSGTSGGQPAQFDILLRFAPGSTTPVPLRGCENCVIIESAAVAAAPGNALYAQILNPDGSAVPVYGPTYFAGNIGFTAVWTRPVGSPPEPVPVGALYQLIQYRIRNTGGYSGSVWSLPVGPVRDTAANLPPAGALDHWQYTQVLPTYLFRGSQSPDAPSPYSTVGDPIALEFRLTDVYGNVLPSGYQTSFTPQYQDPLITLGEWPGVTANYYFRPGTGGAADLVLNATFDPSALVSSTSPPSPDDVRNQWQKILDRYDLILDQLTDPNVSVVVVSSLSSAPLGGAGEPAGNLTAFATAIRDQIAASLDSYSSPVIDVSPIQATWILPLPLAAVAALAVDIVQVRTEIVWARDPALVYPPAKRQLPSVVRATHVLLPDLNVAPPRSPTGTASQSTLANFALNFEAAFAGFDGADGLLKLTQRSGISYGPGATVDTVWAVRWSTSVGISVEFLADGGSPDSSIAYFGMKPLSTKLMTDTFDGRTYSNVDLDAWAEQFLRQFDAFLSPGNAIAVAILDQRDPTGTDAFYDQLIQAKQTLAGAIPKGLTPIFADSPAGDPEGARERLTQSLLTALANAFAVTTVVQFRARVQVVGPAESGASPPSKAPQLFGSVAPPVGTSLSNPKAPSKQYTLSNGEFEIATGEPWMTTLLTVADPSLQTSLALSLAYQVSFLQHDFRPEEEYLDYVPSSWLKFVLPTTGPLTIPIRDVEIPVPLIFYPQEPALSNQSAGGAPLGSPGGSPESIRQEIADILRWLYRATLTHTWVAQDELYFTVTYNPAASLSAVRAADADPLRDLFGALVSYREWYSVNAASFGLIAQEAYGTTGGSPAGPIGSPSLARTVIQGFAAQVSQVAAAWAGLYEPRARAALTGGSPAIIDDFMVRIAGTRLHLFARNDSTGEGPTYWPTVATTPDGPGWAPDPSRARPVQIGQKVWFALDHDFGDAGWGGSPRGPTEFGQLYLTWGPVDLLERQSARMDAYVVRNASLVDGRTTNPEFVYTTSRVSFPNPVIPLIDRASVPAIQPEATLSATLFDILDPITKPGSDLNPVLRLEAGYAFQVTAPPQGAPLMSEIPILLADNIDLSVSGSPTARIAEDMAGAISAWYLKTLPSTAGAIITLAVILFGAVQGQQLPLVQIRSIPIDVSRVPRSFWDGTGAP